MNKTEFYDYRVHGVGYRLPSPEKVKSYPYVVVQDGVYGTFFTGLDYYGADESEKVKDKLVNLLSKVKTAEKDKEERFINLYLREIKEKDPEFYAAIAPLAQAGQYSKFITVLKARERDLYKLDLDSANNIKRISDQWVKTQNRYFLDTLENSIKNNVGKRSIYSTKENAASLDQTFDEILENASKEFSKNLNKDLDTSYKEQLQETWKLFEKEVRKNLGTIGFDPAVDAFRDYVNKIPVGDTIKEYKTKTGKTGHRKLQVATAAKKLIKELMVNGISAEYFLDVGGAARTGGIKKKYTSFTGKNSKTGNIQSDAIEGYGLDMTLDSDFSEMIKSLMNSEGDVSAEIKKAIDLYSEDKFVIHYSAKDLYTHSTVKRASLRGSGGFDYRIEELRQIANEIGDSNIDNLIFGIVNSGAGMVAEGNRDAIRQSIVSMCATWMFEDYMDTFGQIKGGSNNKLHLYFINGNYYTVSEILNLTLMRLKGLIKENVITATLSSPRHNIYGIVKAENKIRKIPRWEEVRDRTLSTGKIGLRINTTVLETLLLSL